MTLSDLDAVDKKILDLLDKNCRLPNSQIAKRVGRSRETVGYRIQQLEDKGIIQKFITSINPNKLGHYMFKVYLKLENIPQERESFFESLKTNQDVYWMGISDGAFDCVFAFISKTITGYYEKINTLLSKWQHLIIAKVHGTMVDTHQYNKKFFLNDTDGSAVTFGGDVVQVDVDELDLNILELLANDARISFSDLARTLDSTIDIVRRRIKKLEDEGVILGYRIAVDFNKLGLEFFKMFIYFRTLSPEDEASLMEWMRTHPKSLYYIRSLAPWEMEPEFAVAHYKEFNEIVSELRQKFPHIIRNYEHLIMVYENWMPAYKQLFRP